MVGQSPFDQRHAGGQDWLQGRFRRSPAPPAGADNELAPNTGLFARLYSERGAWFGWVPVAVGSGAGVYFVLTTEPGLWLALSLVLAAATLKYLSQGETPLGVAATLMVLAAVGFAAAKARTEWVRAPILERSLGWVDITGLVERVEPKPKRGARLTLRPISIGTLERDALPFRIRVRVLKTIKGLEPGVAVRLKARLAPPPPPALPGGFDFARHAWFQGIGAVGYGFSAPKIVPHTQPVPWSLQIRAAIETVRQTIAARMRAILPGQSGAIAIALVTGERGGISEDTNNVYRDAGLYHILSISGMHMAVMAGAVFILMRLAFAAVPALVLNYPVKKWAAVIAAIAALGYLALSGSAFATVRSYIMISVMFFAVLVDRPALALRNVALAAVFILLMFPESILDPGFQMSFAAVAALISTYEYLRRVRPAWSFSAFGPVRKAAFFLAGIVVTTLVAGAAVAPFAAYHFHNTQHLAVLANLIAMPVSNVVIMPAALGVLVLVPFGLEWPAVVAMGTGINVMTATAEWVAALPGAVGRIATLPQVAFLLIVAGGLWLVLWQTRWRLFGVAAIAAGVALAPYGARPDILIGNKGKEVAIRAGDGLLTPIKDKRRASFELKRWFEADGQVPRQALARNAAESQPVRRCDAVGCVAQLVGARLAVAHHASALRDDCRYADIVVFNDPIPKGCDKPRAIVDFFDIYYGGTHALYLNDTEPPRIESVASVRGERPWTKALPGRDRSRRKRDSIAKSDSESSDSKSSDADKTAEQSAPASFDDGADAPSDHDILDEDDGL